MNKQEVIKKIETCKTEYDCETRDVWCYKKGFEDARSSALNIIKQLDEPEKPVLSKEEAEWVDELTDVYDVPDALYYITRCGYGYDFTFEICGKTYELPLEDGITYGELYKLKERLVNAVLYGYEVEKEKLYTARLRLLNNDYNFLNRNREDDRILFSDGEEGHCYTTYFTQTELEELNVWNNPAFEVEEVEE